MIKTYNTKQGDIGYEVEEYRKKSSSGRSISDIEKLLSEINL